MRKMVGRARIYETCGLFVLGKDATKDLTRFLYFGTENIGFPSIDSVLVMVSSVRSLRPKCS